MLLAANCSEYKAWEAELEYLRADFAGDVPAAKDAREKAKRLNARTAKRRYVAYQRAMAAYDFDPAAKEFECPFLFDDQEELTFLLGLLTGMQAIVNDANSGAMAGVPRNIAPRAERAAECLDNEKWGGLPNAIRGMVWLLLPDTRPSLSPDRSSPHPAQAGAVWKRTQPTSRTPSRQEATPFTFWHTATTANASPRRFVSIHCPCSSADATPGCTTACGDSFAPSTRISFMPRATRPLTWSVQSVI